jgi:cell division septum initiation protein DivIVA
MSFIDVNNLASQLSNCHIQPPPNYFNLYNELKLENLELRNRIKFLELDVQSKDQIINDQNKYIVASKTAKEGFKEEDLVINDLNQIEELKFNLSNFLDKPLETFYKNIGTSKTDISDGKTNIQVKKHKINQFGQIDRHYISYFFEKIPELENHKKILESMCMLPILDNGLCDKNKEVVKMTIDNYQQNELDDLIKDLNKYKSKVIDYAFLGYEEKNKPNVLLGVEYDKEKNRNKMIFYKMKSVIKYLNTQQFKIRKSGTVIELGDTFTMQRKGGDSGKKTANHLQFKLVFSKLQIDNKLVHLIE